MLKRALKNLPKAESLIVPVICCSLGAVGVVGAATPSYASSIRGAIFARALSLSGQATGAPVSGTDFLTGHYYRFDFGITDNNTPTVSTSATTQWGPNNPSNSGLTGPLFSYFTIKKCASTTGITNCSSGVTIPGVVGGTYNPSPTWGSGTDLQKFAVGGLPATSMDTPELNLSFGATSGTTGLTTKYNNLSAQSISNVEVGCSVSMGCSGDLSKLFIDNVPGWNPVGTGISSLTASNIVQNLNLTMFNPSSFGNPNMSTSPSSPRCTTTSTPNAPCELAIRIAGESGGIYFNINSVEFTSVPGPLPISAAVVAFGCSRKLRARVRALSN